MYGHNKETNQWNWQQTAKVIIALIVSIYIFRAGYSIVLTNESIGFMSSLLTKQEADYKKLHGDGDAEVRKVQEGIAGGAAEMDVAAKHFENHLDNFFTDFHDSLDEAIAKHEKQIKKEFMSDFMESHVKYYDADMYEADRRKAMEESHYQIPDYIQYSNLRENAMRCQMEAHNKLEEREYRNEIARLKAEHLENQISAVKKPEYWGWPLTREQVHNIESDSFNLVFVYLTSDGKCKNG